MGNFSSSCTAAPPRVNSSAPVSRVLLIDGSMLKFQSPIKVIHLLLDYPNHVICPLDTLTPGLHSLSTLLPDEKLQLGRLYLLLPFKTHMQQQQQQQQQQKQTSSACIKSKQAKRQHTLDTRMLLQDRGAQDHLAISYAQDQERAKLLDVGLEQSKVGSAKYDEFNKNSSSSLAREEYYSEEKWRGKDFCKIAHLKERQGFKENADMGPSNIGDPKKSREMGLAYSYAGCRRSEASYGKLGSERRRGKESSERSNKVCVVPRHSCKRENGPGPLCDTPELQRAYRSLLLRRSSTWTPRLQPIMEKR
ncbi:hypothetical protein L7F22_023849 [Adiantum nelumboides]|nr:hypothetical protein [Adiantum nelumboides]